MCSSQNFRYLHFDCVNRMCSSIGRFVVVTGDVSNVPELIKKKLGKASIWQVILRVMGLDF